MWEDKHDDIAKAIEDNRKVIFYALLKERLNGTRNLSHVYHITIDYDLIANDCIIQSTVINDSKVNTFVISKKDLLNDLNDTIERITYNCRKIITDRYNSMVMDTTIRKVFKELKMKELFSDELFSNAIDEYLWIETYEELYDKEDDDSSSEKTLLDVTEHEFANLDPNDKKKSDEIDKFVTFLVEESSVLTVFLSRLFEFGFDINTSTIVGSKINIIGSISSYMLDDIYLCVGGHFEMIDRDPEQSNTGIGIVFPKWEHVISVEDLSAIIKDIFFKLFSYIWKLTSQPVKITVKKYVHGEVIHSEYNTILSSLNEEE